ncbi:unnamed protein product [Prorocentrum cordatum]|nr:unnamed protein product [Polarella glacialis]
MTSKESLAKRKQSTTYTDETKPLGTGDPSYGIGKSGKRKDEPEAGKKAARTGSSAKRTEAKKTSHGQGGIENIKRRPLDGGEERAAKEAKGRQATRRGDNPTEELLE